MLRGGPPSRFEGFRLQIGRDRIEDLAEVAANQPERGYGRNGNQGGNQAVLNSGGAALVLGKVLKNTDHPNVSRRADEIAGEGGIRLAPRSYRIR